MFWLNLAWKSAWSRKYSLCLVAVSVCLSVIILLGVQQIRTDAKQSFSNALSGVDLVVGPRGSQTDLLLYSVFQLGAPTQICLTQICKESINCRLWPGPYPFSWATHLMAFLSWEHPLSFSSTTNLLAKTCRFKWVSPLRTRRSMLVL